MPQLLLTCWRSPGDIAAMTACVRDLSISYPDRFEIHTGGSCPELWQYNPHVRHSWGQRLPRGMKPVRLDYHRQIADANTTKLHLLTAFHRELSDQLEIPVPVLRPRPDLHFSSGELSHPPIEPGYWLINAGGKRSLRAKVWPQSCWQELVARLTSSNLRVIQVGALSPGHEHPTLSGAICQLGQTNLRQLMRLVYFSAGVISSPSLLMHLAAAFEKPAVIIAGGREPYWWAAYRNSPERTFGPVSEKIRVPQRFLHTMGDLDCCQDSGCWKTSVTTTSTSPSDCSYPVDFGNATVAPKCLSMITAADVASAVLSYNR